jgi:uncharacterized membrane protein YdbT with pleckstrin-like domain
MNMEPIIFRPDIKYLGKLIVSAALGAFPVGIVLLILLSKVAMQGLTLLPLILYLVIAVLGAAVYYNTIHYEIRQDEVIVYAGFITKTVKHVPFRTITNLQVTRGLLDRLLGLGSLYIETAGSSGVASPEENWSAWRMCRRFTNMLPTNSGAFRGVCHPPSQLTNSRAQPMNNNS